MSAGKLSGDSPPSDLREPLADALDDDESLRLSWAADDVRWATERTTDVLSAAAFAATDRRVVVATDEAVRSIGYDSVRAVETDSDGDAPDLSTAFLACGGLGLLVGLTVATTDLANGAGLVALSVALLAAGTASDESSRCASVSIVVGNERQRLTFAADQDVGEALAALADAS